MKVKLTRPNYTTGDRERFLEQTEGTVMEASADRYNIRWPGGNYGWYPQSQVIEVGTEHLSEAERGILRDLQKKERELVASVTTRARTLAEDEQKLADLREQLEAQRAIIERIKK